MSMDAGITGIAVGSWSMPDDTDAPELSDADLSLEALDLRS